MFQRLDEKPQAEAPGTSSLSAGLLWRLYPSRLPVSESRSARPGAFTTNLKQHASCLRHIAKALQVARLRLALLWHIEYSVRVAASGSG
jgi:hypothetical protein